MAAGKGTERIAADLRMVMWHSNWSNRINGEIYRCSVRSDLLHLVKCHNPSNGRYP